MSDLGCRILECLPDVDSFCWGFATAFTRCYMVLGGPDGVAMILLGFRDFGFWRVVCGFEVGYQKRSRGGEGRAGEESQYLDPPNVGSCRLLSCWVHKRQKVYTFSFIVGTTIPESVKCIHSATKAMGVRVWEVLLLMIQTWLVSLKNSEPKTRNPNNVGTWLRILGPLSGCLIWIILCWGYRRRVS